MSATALAPAGTKTAAGKISNQMSFTLIASTVLGTVTLILSALAQVALWQQKEYRWDRLWSHLKSSQGSLLNFPLVLLAALAILIGWLSYISTFLPLTKGESPPWAGEGVGFLALLFFLLHHALRIKKRGVLRPDFTTRTIATLILSLLIPVFFLFSLPLEASAKWGFFPFQQLVALQLASFIFLVPGLVALAVWLGGIPFQIRKRQIIALGRRLRSSRTHLTVVGITGSYGKTSTKHFLEQILEVAGKNAAATKAHHNTPIGIAQDVLQHLTPDLEIYVAELGAYRRGEIKELADIVRPQIGVITAIGSQHLDLFGSPENILKTKWELAESLPENGIAVLNADDVRLAKAAANFPREVIWYSIKRRADVWVSHVSLTPAKILCTLHLNDFSRGLTIPLASEALLGSALAAAAAALSLKISPESIASALETLTAFPRTMEILAGKNGATVIDDSHSANEHGTLLAIRHLSRFSQPDKRIAFLPFLELGKETEAAHARVEETAKAAGAKLYIYKRNPKEFAREISQDLSEKSVILLEGRLPDVVRKVVLL